MSSKKSEAMSDKQLEAVTGGSGADCMAMLLQLKEAGFADVKTVLVAGNEKEAAQELTDFLNGLNNGAGAAAFKGTEIHADDTANVYKVCGRTVTPDQLMNHIRIMLGE